MNHDQSFYMSFDVTFDFLFKMTRLLERLEQYMIDETLQRVQKEAKLVQAERGREENTITNDLWKKSVSVRIRTNVGM